jgi:hypothetical protein
MDKNHRGRGPHLDRDHGNQQPQRDPHHPLLLGRTVGDLGDQGEDGAVAVVALQEKRELSSGGVEGLMKGEAKGTLE